MNETVSIEQTVREIVAEVLGISTDALLAAPALAAHDWDSFSSLHALAELESRLGTEFDLRTFHTVRTVDEMVVLAVAVAGRKDVR